MRELALTYVAGFERFGREDIARAGGKNASLGEMTRRLSGAGIAVPPGFAVTANAYWKFVDCNELRGGMRAALGRLAAGKSTLEVTGACIRAALLRAEWPAEVSAEISQAYSMLSDSAGSKHGADVAVRSSATAEDLPEASFAGQQETYLSKRARRRGATRELQALLRLAVYRPGDFLPSGQRL